MYSLSSNWYRRMQLVHNQIPVWDMVVVVMVVVVILDSPMGQLQEDKEQ